MILGLSCIYVLLMIVTFIFVYMILLSEFKQLNSVKLVSFIIAIIWPFFIGFLVIMFLLSKAVPKETEEQEDK